MNSLTYEHDPPVSVDCGDDPGAGGRHPGAGLHVLPLHGHQVPPLVPHYQHLIIIIISIIIIIIIIVGDDDADANAALSHSQWWH